MPPREGNAMHFFPHLTALDLQMSKTILVVPHNAEHRLSLPMRLAAPLSPLSRSTGSGLSAPRHHALSAHAR